MRYETVIGLEVHSQLLTESKMFCSCGAGYASSSPNTLVCPVCLGMPGVLPVINKQAIEFTMMTALALNCKVSEYTKFDRKNYSYPDLMKGYQISQYDEPVGKAGMLSIEIGGKQKNIGITRVHLEEDVSKLIHRDKSDDAHSLVDVNRSGVPLMEIVSEPDMRSPEEARQYLIKLRAILQYLGVSTGNMEEGSFRCDANISIRPEGSSALGGKVEVKNMNSFRAVFRAMEYEEKRQRDMAELGQRLPQETRGWIEEESVTVSQRSKEFAHDYRYFPEPDLPPLIIKDDWIDKVRRQLPELPEVRQDRFMNQYGLSSYDSRLITNSKTMADYFESCLGKDLSGEKLSKRAKTACNWILGEFARLLNANNIEINQSKIIPVKLCHLLDMVEENKINLTTAKEVFEEMFNTGDLAGDIVNRRGLSQISDTASLENDIAEVIKNNPAPVSDYKAGKETAIRYLVGQVMKATRGRGNPKLINELLEKKLKEAN